MKKLLIVLLALTVISVFAFADDAAAAPAPVGQFHISNYGELFTYASVGGGGATVGWGPNWDPNHGVDQDWDFTYDGNGFGYAGRFEFAMGNILASTTGWGNIKSFKAYYDLGKYVKFTAGQLDVTDYRWSTFIEGAFNQRFGGRVFAGMVQVYPVDGLSLAVLENVPGQTLDIPGVTNLKAYGYKDVPGITQASLSSYGTTVPADYQDWTNLAASYEMKDVAKFYAAWNNTLQEVSLGVNVSAIKPVSIQVVYDYDYVPLATSTSASTIWATASYTKDALAVSLDLGYGTGTSWYAQTAFAFEINPEYTIGKFAVGALLGYDNGYGLGLFGGQDNTWDGAEIYPYVKANFDNGSFVQVGVLYASGSGVAASANGGQSLLSIPITYSVSF